jgi:tetratricopeptide (TPR) repeat protein
VNSAKSPREPSRRYDALVDEVNGAIAAGQIDRAIVLAEQALTEGPEEAALLNLVAYGRMGANKHEEALGMLKRARVLAPGDINVLNSLGICLRRLGRYTDSVEAFDAALRVAPNFGVAHYSRGTALEESMRSDEAFLSYETAVRLLPDHADAHARLAFLLASRGDDDRAKTLALRALHLDPGNPSAAMALAISELGAGSLDEARRRVAGVLEQTSSLPNLHAIAVGLLADIDDRAGDTRAAFAGYLASKEQLKRIFAPQFAPPGEPGYTQRVNAMAEYFAAAPDKAWAARRANGHAARQAEHVFLVGFPRSGTTLLEAALGGHPALETMEEKEGFADAGREFLWTEGGLARLETMNDAQLEPYRDAYWRSCRDALPGLGSKILVDKLPMNTVVLCLIAKLFPTAKILFAIRDPRDVVFSCLRRRFVMNPAMYELCTPDDAARLYDAVMRLAEIYRKKLALDILDTRYEDLVADFAGGLRRICEFLGIAFDARMLDVKAQARVRSINTPSARQVRRGVYKEGEGQWRRYKTELAPILPILAPWVLRFGYPAE